MTTSPVPACPRQGVQPIDPPADLSEAQQALSDFERAFVLAGTRAQFHRAAKLVMPFVEALPYDCLLDVCACADLELWYIRDPAAGSWFYGVCHLHRLQKLGRAVKARRADNPDRTHRRRSSGYTTERWHAARGL